MVMTAPSQPAAPGASAARVISAVSPRDEVVSIGPVLPDDMGNLFLWLNDAKAAALDMPYRPVDGFAFKEWLDRQAMAEQQMLFSLRTLSPPRMIGFVIFKNLQQAYRSIEVGIRIGQEQDRGSGHGTRALRLALDHAWNTLNLNRVSLTVFAGNTRAIAAYRRAGFVEEGVMRKAAYTGGRWHDVVIMAALNPAG